MPSGELARFMKEFASFGDTVDISVTQASPATEGQALVGVYASCISRLVRLLPVRRLAKLRKSLSPAVHGSLTAGSAGLPTLTIIVSPSTHRSAPHHSTVTSADVMRWWAGCSHRCPSHTLMVGVLIVLGFLLFYVLSSESGLIPMFIYLQ